jgi:hypothetical protein
MALRCVVRGGAEVWRHVQRRSTARRWWSGDGDCLAEDWRGDNGVSQHRTTSGDNGDGSDSNDMQAREALRAGAEAQRLCDGSAVCGARRGGSVVNTLLFMFMQAGEALRAGAEDR